MLVNPGIVLISLRRTRSLPLSRKKSTRAMPEHSTAWKAARAEGLVVAAGLAAGVPVIPFVVSDLKRHVGGGMRAPKERIVERAYELVVGLEEAMAAVAKSHREHLGDAAGYAYLALGEIDKMRELTGMRP